MLGIEECRLVKIIYHTPKMVRVAMGKENMGDVICRNARRVECIKQLPRNELIYLIMLHLWAHQSPIDIFHLHLADDFGGIVRVRDGKGAINAALMGVDDRL